MTYNGINFNGDQGTALGCRYWCNFNNANWWLADRLLLLVYVPTVYPENEEICLNVYNSGIGSSYYPDIITYQPDSNKYCIIDLTEIARTFAPNTHSISLWYGQAGNPPAQEDIAYILTSAAKGLINPAGVIIPSHPLEDYGVQILPPSYMIGAMGSDTDFLPLQYEFRGEGSWKCTEYEPEPFTPLPITQPTYRLDDLGTVKFIIERNGQAPQPSETFVLQEMDCEKRYAQVRWVSFTGATRIHIFEVRKAKNETANAFSLLNLAGEFTEIKGRQDTFKLYLDHLNAYDFWYYADILQSSKVEVCLGSQIFRRVSVTTKSVTIPDTNIFDNKLEIDVKWRDYDAIIL